LSSYLFHSQWYDSLSLLLVVRPTHSPVLHHHQQTSIPIAVKDFMDDKAQRHTTTTRERETRGNSKTGRHIIWNTPTIIVIITIVVNQEQHQD
jgi:hypothetical protein